MNRYTLNADGHRWWWGPALAGTGATLAAAAIVAMPTAGQAMPVPTTRHEQPLTYVVTDYAPTTPTTRQNCFIYRADWNVALDGPRPVCTWGAPSEVTAPDDPGVMRAGLDWTP